MRQFLLTLWNTYSFWVLYANADGVQAADLNSVGPENELDRWALSRLQGVKETATNTSRASTAPGPARRSPPTSTSSRTGTCGSRGGASGTATAPPSRRCGTCLIEVAALLAPFIPFLADEIYVNLAGGAGEEFGERPDSVHLADYPDARRRARRPGLDAGMEATRRAVELGRAARAQAGAKIAPAAAPRR